MTYVYLIFIGHHKERQLSSIKHWQKDYPPGKFILIIGQEKTSGEQKAEEIAKEMQQELKTPLFNVVIERVSKLDLFQAIRQLREIILPLKAEGSKVLLDISGSLRIFTVAGYIVACLIQSELVSVVPKYDANFNEIGIEEFFKIPTLLLFKLKEEQYKILTAIGVGVGSMESLVFKVSPDCKSDKVKIQSERNRITYYLNSLVSLGFVTRIREGKNVRIQLTELGKIYSKITQEG